jgi:hypothetical protein
MSGTDQVTDLHIFFVNPLELTGRQCEHAVRVCVSILGQLSTGEWMARLGGATSKKGVERLLDDAGSSLKLLPPGTLGVGNTTNITLSPDPHVNDPPATLVVESGDGAMVAGLVDPRDARHLPRAVFQTMLFVAERLDKLKRRQGLNTSRRGNQVLTGRKERRLAAIKTYLDNSYNPKTVYRDETLKQIRSYLLEVDNEAATSRENPVTKQKEPISLETVRNNVREVLRLTKPRFGKRK